jgi:hypothetical protein
MIMLVCIAQRSVNITLKARNMKTGQEAVAQYGELANALVQMGASWIVAEVEQVISRGKTVPFRDLSEEESAQYESRLTEEASRGLPVGRAKATGSASWCYVAGCLNVCMSARFDFGVRAG